METKPKIVVQPVTYADIDALVKISADSFIEDRHTQIKQLGRKPFDMAAIAKFNLHRNLGIDRCAYMKAVNEDTGEILGYCGWGFRLPNNDVVPRSDPGLPPAVMPSDYMGGTKEDQGEEDSIDRLGAMEDADMKRWMEIFMPDKNTQCMYILTLSVAPKAHGQGVGSALAQWGTDIADRLGLFIWVHSSEDAWMFYRRHGFEVIGELDIDLDEWAPQPPPKEEGEDAKWGHYVLRYMKRLSVKET